MLDVSVGILNHVRVIYMFLEKALLKQVLANQEQIKAQAETNHDEVMDAHDVHDDHLTTLLTQPPVSLTSGALLQLELAEEAERARLEAEKTRLAREAAEKEKARCARNIPNNRPNKSW